MERAIRVVLLSIKRTRVLGKTSTDVEKGFIFPGVDTKTPLETCRKLFRVSRSDDTGLDSDRARQFLATKL